MNIVKIIKQKGSSIGIKYYGIGDMATGIMVKQMLENKNEILSHYNNKKITCVDDYIDYVFIEITVKFFEVIPLVIEEKREEFSSFLEKCKAIYESYEIKEVIKYLRENYLEVYKYKDRDVELFIEHDLRVYTSNFIGKYFRAFTKENIDYVINEITYDVIDNFEMWEKYFIKNPKELKRLFSEKNIKKTFSLRFEEIASIVENFKENKKFEDEIKIILDIIYKVVKERVFDPKDEQEIWQSYYAINDCFDFFKKMQSPYAHELEKELEKQEVTFNENLLKNGKQMKIELDLKPFVDFFDNEEIPWEIRIVRLTHSEDENGNLVSFLEQGASCDVKALTDELSRKNPGTTEYFTSWRLRNLKLYSFEIESRISLLLSDIKRFENYMSSMYGELNYICSNIDTTIQDEGIDKNMEMLMHYLTDIFFVFPKDNNMPTSKIEASIYGCSMLLCGLIEKIMRVVYKNNMKNTSFVFDSNITLGNLLKSDVTNKNIILEILGDEQSKVLQYYLHKSMPEFIGENIRNDLAHLNGKTMKRLNFELVLELISYYNSILSSMVLYYQRKKKDE